MAKPDDSPDDIFLPGGLLRMDLLSDAAAHAVSESLRFARETHWDSIRSPHIFMGLLAAPDEGVRLWGGRLGANLARLLEQFQELFNQDDDDSDSLLLLNREFLSDNVIRLLRDAHARACDQRRECITPMDLLITLLTTTNSIVAECFERIGVTAAKLTEHAVMAEQLADRNKSPFEEQP